MEALLGKSLTMLRNLQANSTSSSSNELESGSEDDSIRQEYERATSFRNTMNDIKKRLKTKRGYESAVQDLLGLIETDLNYENKRLFYDCLNIISHRIGKPGFSASVAKPLFDAAWSRNFIFTPGFRKNIEDWKNTIDSLVSNPSQTTSTSIERNDGRFGSRKTVNTSKRKERTRAPEISDLAQLLLLRQLYQRANSNFSDSEDDEDYDSDDVIHPFASSLNLPSNFPVRVPDVPYPYVSEVKDLPPPMNIVSIGHSSDPIISQFSFILSDKHIERSIGTTKIMLCVYSAGSHNRTAPEYPRAVSYHINNNSISNVPDGDNKYFTGIDITSKCQVGKNTLTIRAISCVCSYEFSVRLLDVKSVTNITNEIKEKKTLDYSTSLARVISSFSTDKDIVQLSSRISLRCPLSQTRILNPARGSLCSHIQCFDLESYLSINKNNPKFKCPVCNRSVGHSDLIIDSYFKSLLQENSIETTDEVEILPDGKWKVPEARSGKRKSPFEAETVTKRQFIIAENDLSPSPVNTLLPPKILKPVKVEIIDLT